MSLFQKAVKHDAKLRLAISGPSGSGKTYTALTIATNMSSGKRIALVDTEHGSASKYADLFDFDVAEMHAPFHPDKFAEAIRDAAQAGYGVIILDSLTHAWNGEGGMLELVTEIAKRKYRDNSYAAWIDATPIQKRLIESIVGAQIHVIATMRSKMDYVLDKDEKSGKSSPRKVGMAPQQRDDMPYEFDVMLDMNVDNEAIVTKTRCPALNGRVINKPGKEVAATLVKWLSAEPAQTPQAPVTKPATNANGATKPATSAPVITQAEIAATDAITLESVPEIPQDGNDNPFTPDAAQIHRITEGFNLPKDAWAWASGNHYTENEHSARTRWATIVKEKFDNAYTPAKLPAIAREYVAYYLAKASAAQAA